MDPLSITASVIAVATLAAKTCSAFARLRSVCKAMPGRLHALNNEVIDFEVVCYQVAAIFSERERLSFGGTESTPNHIQQLLKQANAKLTELKSIIDNITATTRQSKVPVLALQTWRREQERLQTLQEDIKTVKCTLNIMLGASQS